MSTLYGVSVGPGDPQLMTLKALRIIESCGVLAVPRTGGENTLALSIAGQAACIKDKRKIYLDIPMTNDRKLFEASCADIAERLCAELENGDVAFLTLGDISVYSTFGYIGCRVKALGFSVEMCAGVTSFCAAAASLGEPLCLGREQLHIIPYSCGDIEKALELKGTKVIMKAGRNAGELISLLRRKGLADRTRIISDCGLPGERIYCCNGELPEAFGYFSTFIITDGES